MPDSVPPIRIAPPRQTTDGSAAGPYERQRRAIDAAREVLADRFRLEADELVQLEGRLKDLRDQLQATLLRGATSWRIAQVRALLRDVDQLLADTTLLIGRDVGQALTRIAALGEQLPEQALRGAQVLVMPTAPGVSSELVMAAYENTLDLLSPAMQQFRSEIGSSVRRVALAGDNRMEEIQRLQAVLEGQGFANAQYRAERIVRTELGRTFNGAAHDGFERLADQAPYLRKSWLATKDARTRRGHAEAGVRYRRGQGIPVTERFTLTHYDHKGVAQGTVQLRYPLDPNAEPAGRLAAANTIMCRCSSFVDFALAEFAETSRQRIAMALRDARPRAPA